MLQMAQSVLNIISSILSLEIMKDEKELRKEKEEIENGLREIQAQYNEVDYDKMDMALYDSYLFRLRLLTDNIATALRSNTNL